MPTVKSEEDRLLFMHPVCKRGQVEITRRFDDEWSQISRCAYGHCLLYRFLDHDETLLYVGVTRLKTGERWAGHRRKKLWWPEIRVARLECYPKEHVALIAERRAIRAERPKYNLRSAVA